MKKDKLDKWLNALRSGAFKNIAGALRNNEGYCAMGILCEISGLSNWEPQKDCTRLKYLGQDKYLPKEVAEWAGMSPEEISSVTAFLIAYNDQVRVSFYDVANLLEDNYKISPKKKV